MDKLTTTWNFESHTEDELIGAYTMSLVNFLGTQDRVEMALTHAIAAEVCRVLKKYYCSKYSLETLIEKEQIAVFKYFQLMELPKDVLGESIASSLKALTQN